MTSQGYVEWSTLQQNPAYIDALSNPLTQWYSQVTIDMNALISVRTLCSYSQLCWIAHFLQNLLSQSILYIWPQLAIWSLDIKNFL